MATKSRLGRDPLSGVAKPAATKKASRSTPNPRTPKKTPAKAAPETSGSTAPPVKARSMEAATVAAPIETASAVPVVHEETTAAPAFEVQPIPVSEELPEGYVAPTSFDTADYASASPEQMIDTPASEVQPIPVSVSLSDESAPAPAAVPVSPEPTTVTPAIEVQPIPASEEIPEGYATPAAFDTTEYTSASPEQMIDTPVSAVQPIPVSVQVPDAQIVAAAIPPVPETTTTACQPQAPCSSAASSPLPEGPHPAEVFLRGVLESLTPEGGLKLRVDVDPETFSLPVEKLFYFSHVLQLLVSPLECPSDSWRRPHDGRGPLAALTVRLRKIAKDRHSLRIFDNGLFFSQYLSDIRLEMEALRPLVLFVIKRRGSICLKQARCVEFEIIG